TRRATDAGDEHGSRRVRADHRQRALHRLQDRIVAAAGAPAHFLIGLPILERGLVARLGEGGNVGHASIPSMAASISAMRKGWPEILLRDLASTRYWSRSTVLSWPVFISGMRICS